MDKRRYRPKDVRKDKPLGISADETGNAAADGYTVRNRSPLKRKRELYSEEGFRSPTLRGENESFLDDYLGDF